jgi:hypothetical protein
MSGKIRLTLIAKLRISFSVRAKAAEDELKMTYGPEDVDSLLKKIKDLSEKFATDSSSFVGPMQVIKIPLRPSPPPYHLYFSFRRSKVRPYHLLPSEKYSTEYFLFA